MNLKHKKFSEIELKKIQKTANSARAAILKMTTLAKSGHPGGSLSSIDFLLVLYNLININPKKPEWENRDRVIISNGHISPAVYATLGLMDFFDLDDAISQFRLAGSIFEGHVEPDVSGVEWASGNLGQGLSAGCGFALACKQKKIDNNIFVIMGDGEQQKGQLSEARRFAVKYHLNKITAFCDYNQLQICGDINKIMPQNIIENYVSDGWDVIEIDGHNLNEIQNAIFDAVQNDAPTLILANTIMGKGVSFMENQAKYHGSTLTEEQLELAFKELGLSDDLEKYKELRNNFNSLNSAQDNSFFDNTDFDLNIGKPILYKEKNDNRSAWGNAIADIAIRNLDMEISNSIAVFDCDLQGSVKTTKFAEIAPDNFYECGIMEHHTATMAGAMSKNGIQVFFADFGVFGVDETFNQHRLNDINKTNLKVITTHVGLDVGEDGKTHQCIDYVGVMKNLYNFNIIIPADPNQTDRIIRYISRKYGNYLISMGRSKLDIIKTKAGKIFFDENYKFEYGKADKLRDGKDAALFVMGTLTPKAIEIADKLSAENINLQVWNISCPTKINEDALKEAAKTGTIFTYEDHNVNTGLGNCLADKMIEMGLSSKFYKFGVEDYAISGKSDAVFKFFKLDVASIIEKVTNRLK